MFDCIVYVQDGVVILFKIQTKKNKFNHFDRHPIKIPTISGETPFLSFSIVFKYSSQNHLSILFEERRKNNESKKETKYTL